ncbi:MAG: SMC-Scp complex subunit ScpB [Solirubrobacterales bacterium]|nr:SMC-Scp complex subunit ScpB [Solirubrobacterales bacterium]
MTEVEPLVRNLEALLFLAPEPLKVTDLAEACESTEDEVRDALTAVAKELGEQGRGIVLREVAGGWSLSSNPESEDAARRMFAAPRTPPLTAAQAETLAIVAYLQPVSRPEIARIRGVNAESAAATLLERGVIEEAGRSPFGAVLYRTSELFLRLFGLGSIEDLPDIGAWDPAPEVEEALRERLLKVGAERSGDSTTEGQGTLENTEDDRELAAVPSDETGDPQDESASDPEVFEAEDSDEDSSDAEPELDPDTDLPAAN